MQPKRREHDADLQLAHAAAGGSLGAWHEFVTRYSGLIFSIVRRYLVVCDDDEQRTTYVQCLEQFYRSELARYDGRASLGTWVMTVTRSRCLDALRSRRGRKRLPVWLKDMSAQDREIYRLCFLEGRGYREVAEEFRRRGRNFTPEAFGQALQRLDAHMDRGSRARMAYDLQARLTGGTTGRLLEYLDHLRLEQQDRADALRPDHELLQAQTRAVLQRIQSCIERLDEPERAVIRLHFYDGLAAPAIARKLVLPGPRRVYTLIDRGVAMLRSMMGDPALPPDRVSHPEGEG